MIAIPPARSPASEQRPHRTVGISARAVLGRTGGDDPHPPVGFLIVAGQLGNGRRTLVLIQKADPHWPRRQRRGLFSLLMVTVERENVPFLVGRPESLVDERLLAGEFPHQLLVDIFFAGDMGSVR